MLIVERGIAEGKIGTIRDALRYYDANKITRLAATSQEGVILWRSFMAGGSTMVACGNATPCLEKELAQLGLPLADEIAEVKRETGVIATPDTLLSEGSEQIRYAAQSLGYRMEPMPKFMDANKCRRCGQCVLGCAPGGKWTALNYLEDARQAGAEIAYGLQVQQVLIEQGRARGVRVREGRVERELRARTVILAAGGLATPVILQQSGIPEAGGNLFVDLFVNTYGLDHGLNQLREPTMALVDTEFHESDGFIISPYVNHAPLARFNEVGVRGMTLPNNRLLGMMAKITDEAAGRVHPDGTVSKPVTARDRSRLEKGAALSKEILVKAGADPKSLLVSKAQGAHPGGTAAIGQVVDERLQTRVDNLFVCDASVLPTAPGLPPIVTLAALAKRLARTLAP